MQLHPEAKKRFDSEGWELASAVERRARAEQRPPPVDSSSSHRPTVQVEYGDLAHVTLQESSFDDLGFELARFLVTPDASIGLGGVAFVRFRDLITGLARRKELRDLLSVEFIDRVTFQWVIDAHSGGSTETLTDRLLSEAKAAVRPQKVVIPISFLHIQTPFSVGNVRIDFLSREFWDAFEGRARPGFRGTDEEFARHMGDLRERYQGVSVASMEVTAEEGKATELAVWETDKALTVLRAFSPSVFVLRMPSYFGKMGHTAVPTTHALFMEGEGVRRIANWQEGRGPVELVLADDHLARMRTLGLDAASELISRAPQTELEEALLTALSLFSRGIASLDYHDRLVFILASMETVLLKDAREPVQGALAQRVAFLSATSADDRVRVASLIREVYDKRSRYLHHGEMRLQPADRAELERFGELQYRAWAVLSQLLRLKGLGTRAELADHIERDLFT